MTTLQQRQEPGYLNDLEIGEQVRLLAFVRQEGDLFRCMPEWVGRVVTVTNYGGATNLFVQFDIDQETDEGWMLRAVERVEAEAPAVADEYDTSDLSPKKKVMWSLLTSGSPVRLVDTKGMPFTAEWKSSLGVTYLEIRRPDKKRAEEKPIMMRRGLYDWVRNFPDDDIKTT